jgi:hypothetical protein
LALDRCGFRIRLQGFVLFHSEPCNSGLPMKHRSRPPEQDDLLCPRLVEMVDLGHALVKLTALIDWEVIEREWSGFFPSTTGRSAKPPLQVSGCSI